MSRGKYRATPPTLADGEIVEPNLDVNGNLKIAGDIDLDIEPADLGAGAAGAATAVGVTQHINDGTGKRIAMLGDASGHPQVDVVTMPAITGAVTTSGTVTEASASAIKTALEIIDDWDASDHCNIRHLTATDDVVGIGAGTAQIGSLVTPLVAAETVVAGAASVLGKIGTVAAAAIVYVRVPCASASPATLKAAIRIWCDKSWSAIFYKARTVCNAPTMTLTSVQADQYVDVNGLRYTGKAAENTAARQFDRSGTDIAAATSLVNCINAATYGVPGLTAANAAGASNVVTLTATTATTTQCVPSAGTIVCAQAILASLTRIYDAPHVTGGQANTGANATAGTEYTVYADGHPHIYVGLKNDDAVNAATFVVGATLYAA